MASEHMGRDRPAGQHQEQAAILNNCGNFSPCLIKRVLCRDLHSFRAKDFGWSLSENRSASYGYTSGTTSQLIDIGIQVLARIAISVDIGVSDEIAGTCICARLMSSTRVCSVM